jgi:hypothetical protein
MLDSRGYLFGGNEIRGRNYGWWRPRNGHGPNYEGAVMYMQDEGNLVIYDGNHQVIWSSETDGSHPMAINPDLKVVTVEGGTLAVDSSRANTIFENPHREPVTITDGSNAVILERGSPQSVWAPRGPGSLAISGHTYTYDLTRDGGSDDSVAYQSGTVATRSGNLWTVGSGGGAWLVDPSEAVRTPEQVDVPSDEQYEWVDYGMTDDDRAKLNDLPPSESEKGT